MGENGSYLGLDDPWKAGLPCKPKALASFIASSCSDGDISVGCPRVEQISQGLVCILDTEVAKDWTT